MAQINLYSAITNIHESAIVKILLFFANIWTFNIQMSLFDRMMIGSAVTQWSSASLKIEGSWVRASLEALLCVLEQDILSSA